MTVIYLVCSTIRTGSTLLCNYLTDTKLAGIPIDYSDRLYMRKYIDDWKNCHPLTKEYVERVMKIYPSDPFGMKMPYLSVREHIEHNTLRDLFPSDPLYIYITRENILRQAISAVRGMQTGKWYSNAEPRQPVMAENYSKPQIDGMKKELEKRENAWIGYFEYNNLSSYHITYEQLTENPKQTIIQALKFLGINVSSNFILPTPRLQKQADEISLKWEQLYYAQ